MPAFNCPLSVTETSPPLTSKSNVAYACVNPRVASAAELVEDWPLAVNVVKLPDVTVDVYRWVAEAVAPPAPHCAVLSVTEPGGGDVVGRKKLWVHTWVPATDT
jgi:hypothetical protein